MLSAAITVVYITSIRWIHFFGSTLELKPDSNKRKLGYGRVVLMYLLDRFFGESLVKGDI